MAYRNLAKKSFRGPTAPMKRFVEIETKKSKEIKTINWSSTSTGKDHPLTNSKENEKLSQYENSVKGRFDNIVPLLKRVSSFQNDLDFIEKAQNLCRTELGYELPLHILEKAWVGNVDMRSLFAWCVFQSHQLTSNEFFNSDPLEGSLNSQDAKAFQAFLYDCGFHLLDITPCADGRLAHAISFALRIPFSSVRRRSHAGALFDIEKTVNRWVKTEHSRYREASPNPSTEPTRYLKSVVYHFSSVDPLHQGCAAHGSNDELAASEGLQRLLDFREAVENSFCCGASVDLLLIGIDTDTDAIRVHTPSKNNEVDLKSWVCANEIYKETQFLNTQEGLQKIQEKVKCVCPGETDPGMVMFLTRLISNNISQIDYVKNFHDGSYKDAGHAERFIGVGIGFKEIHLRNLTYFAHLETVEQGAPDLDVGVKIFKGLNNSRNLPIPIVIRFDYSGSVPHARDRALADCYRVNEAINSRYRDLIDDGSLHTFLTIRDRDKKAPAEVVGSSLNPILQEAH